MDEKTKPKMGRPLVESIAVNVRIERTLLSRLAAWIAQQPDAPSRPEAIRRILWKALAK